MTSTRRSSCSSTCMHVMLRACRRILIGAIVASCHIFGAYYSASGKATTSISVFSGGHFFRYPEPIQVILRKELHDWDSTWFHSSYGGRAGPTPAWTSPLALVRYPLYPLGFVKVTTDGHASVRTGRVAGAERPSLLPLRSYDLSENSRVHVRLASHPAVAGLSTLADGDLIEVEQWGGWLSHEQCPPICGLWGNLWRGTGVAMRVSTPFVSLNKGTAIIEMLLALGERGATDGLDAIVSDMGLGVMVGRLRRAHPAASRAHCVAAAVLTRTRSRRSRGIASTQPSASGLHTLVAPRRGPLWTHSSRWEPKVAALAQASGGRRRQQPKHLQLDNLLQRTNAREATVGRLGRSTTPSDLGCSGCGERAASALSGGIGCCRRSPACSATRLSCSLPPPTITDCSIRSLPISSCRHISLGASFRTPPRPVRVRPPPAHLPLPTNLAFAWNPSDGWRETAGRGRSSGDGLSFGTIGTFRGSFGCPWHAH